MAVAARSAYYADGRDKSSFDVPGTRRPMRCLLAADLHYSLQQFDWACWTPAGLVGENFSLSRCRVAAAVLRFVYVYGSGQVVPRRATHDGDGSSSTLIDAYVAFSRALRKPWRKSCIGIVCVTSGPGSTRRRAARSR